jgi:ArsR family transcriptional regulator, arsenate/arsenite/antimonite-responsive transcriptional repressor
MQPGAAYHEGMATKTAKETVAMSEEQFRAISRALADPRRYAILQQIGSVAADFSCGDLKEKDEISPATISHHLKELMEAGLIHVGRDGRCANLTMARPVWKAYLKRLQSL